MNYLSKKIGIALTLFSLLINLCLSSVTIAASQEEAILAGGCFWCLEHDLEGLPGVISVQSGYTGGELQNPTYENHKGHQEAVLVKFDPELISYESLLRSYFRNVDPFDGKGQFCDKGDSYRPVIFPKGEDQQRVAIDSVGKAAEELNKTKKSIKVDIKQFDQFWLAEEYHQNFAELNNLKYSFYRFACGRDQRLDEVWGQRSRTDGQWE